MYNFHHGLLFSRVKSCWGTHHISPPFHIVHHVHPDWWEKNVPQTSLPFLKGGATHFAFPSQFPVCTTGVFSPPTVCRGFVLGRTRMVSKSYGVNQLSIAKFISRCFHAPVPKTLSIVFHSPLHHSVFPETGVRAQLVTCFLAQASMGLFWEWVGFRFFLVYRVAVELDFQGQIWCFRQWYGLQGIFFDIQYSLPLWRLCISCLGRFMTVVQYSQFAKPHCIEILCSRETLLVQITWLQQVFRTHG